MRVRLASKAKIFGGLGVLASVAFVSAVTAFACVPGAKITPGPTSGPAGTKITVTGATFDPAGSPVKVYWDGTRGTLMGTVAVQADRSFTISFDVPATATGGTHIISATQLDASGRAYNPVNATFAVAGTRPANASNLQGFAVPEPQPDGATTGAPARATVGRSAAPAATSNTATAAGGARSAAPATSNTPAATANQPVTGPAPAPATEAAVTPFKAPTPTPESAAVADQPAGNRAPAWLLVPLGLMALGFLGAGTGIFLADRKRVRVEAR